MPYTPQQNGVAERKNRSLMEMARCMLKAKSLPHKLWMEAVACAAHVLNRCPTRALKTITPYESWYEKKPSVSYLRVFGCLAYAHIPHQLRGKLDDKTVKCIFVGYSSGSKGYRLYNPATNKIFESRDVIFAKTTAQSMVAFDVPHMQTQDIFEGFLPSFVENQESQQLDNFDQSFDQHVTPHDVEEIVHEEQEVLREERTLPKWVQKTLQDSKLDAPLPRKTRAGLGEEGAFREEGASGDLGEEGAFGDAGAGGDLEEGGAFGGDASGGGDLGEGGVGSILRLVQDFWLETVELLISGLASSGLSLVQIQDWLVSGLVHCCNWSETVFQISGLWLDNLRTVQDLDYWLVVQEQVCLWFRITDSGLVSLWSAFSGSGWLVSGSAVIVFLFYFRFWLVIVIVEF
ncbi:hypothetical protein L7F22_035376 [Adiantum nelumboides]|nr:hypothetical protein [Adiantum nelumboides]